MFVIGTIETHYLTLFYDVIWVFFFLFKAFTMIKIYMLFRFLRNFVMIWRKTRFFVQHLDVTIYHNWVRVRAMHRTPTTSKHSHTLGRVSLQHVKCSHTASYWSIMVSLIFFFIASKHPKLTLTSFHLPSLIQFQQLRFQRLVKSSTKLYLVKRSQSS